MNLEQEIKKVAEELYYKSGCIEGRDKENWFEAERIVMARMQGEAVVKKKNAESLSVAQEQSKTTKTKKCSTSATKSAGVKATKTKKSSK